MNPEPSPAHGAGPPDRQGPPVAPPPLPGDPAAPAPPPLPGDAATGGERPVPEPPVAPGAPHEGDAAPDLPRERAVFQVTEDTRTYPCQSCGDQLVFDITSQRLACPSCGASHDIDDSHLPAPLERDLRATMAELQQRMEEGHALTVQVAGEKEIVCQNCGGHTTFTGTLTATRCPYCATPIQRDDVHEAPARLPVDGVLPFQIDPKQANEAVERWVNSRWFAPNAFKKYKETGSLASVYAAYFTYDAETSTAYRGQRGDTYTVTVGSGDDRRTETRVRWSPRSGTVRDSFDDLAVLANTGFDRKRVTALEPWPTQSARPFTQQYVAGHLSRTYDHDAQECFGEAKARMDDQITQTIKRDIGGDQQRIHAKQTTFHSLGFKHLLLPIWLLTVIYEGTPYQVFINGVTGEVQGDRPWSKVKIALAVIAGLIVAAIVYYLWSQSSASDEAALGLLGVHGSG